ncbi:helicase-associated domain-containing protein [Paenibacillus planticolens]|nr:helicase-associated domain-containing protein [Paenibacillus planticolens]
MRYETVVHRMPEDLKKLISSQTWCASYMKDGVSLSDLLTDRKYLIRLLSHLSVDEKNTLRLILAAFGCESFTREALEKQAGLRMAGAQVAIGLLGLRRTGVIAAFRKAWGEQLFVLPEDAFASWQELLFPSVQLATVEDESALALLPAGAIHVSGDEQDAAPVHPRGLAQQLFHFLAACSQQLSLPLTNKGTLHKKQLAKLTQHISLPNDLLRSSGITYAFRDQYDDGTVLMLELAIRMGFLTGNGEQLFFKKKACMNWLEGAYERQQAQLYSVWRQLLLPAPVWLQHGITWMEKTEAGQWYGIDDILRGILACCSRGAQANEAESLRQAFLNSWILPLSLFRFVELAADANGGVWFRWLFSPGGEDEFGASRASSVESQAKAPSFYVQPDFEILLLPDAGLRTEWDIAAFADLQQTDHVRTYCLTKESFYRAWEQGQSSEEIIRILQEKAYYEVPEPVIQTMRQWGEQAGKVHIEEVTLLRCRSNEIADALLRNEKCQPFLKERVGGADFIVPKDQLSQLAKCLENMGYNPKSSRKEADDPAAESDNFLGNQTQGLCYSRDSIQLYEMDSELPEQGDLYPDMESIPVSWLQDFRSYHGSTRKDMIRKAIEWKSCLQLRKEGQSRVIIPRILREERSGWILEGLEEHKEIALSGDDWEEMKLILPGINDEGVYK